MGHLKSILILAGGFWIFDLDASAKKLLGSFTALGTLNVCLAFRNLPRNVAGCVSYGFFKNEDLNNSTGTTENRDQVVPPRQESGFKDNS